MFHRVPEVRPAGTYMQKQPDGFCACGLHPAADLLDILHAKFWRHAPASPTIRTPSDLFTYREEEVAALVAWGFSSRQVASKLHLSERTAENHVSKILRKLHLNSRAEIAGWATQQRLLALKSE
jgi:DNA-binding NarL/FixJ family response regulator